MCTYTGCSHLLRHRVARLRSRSPMGAIGCGVGMAQIGATGCAAVGDPLGLPLGSVSFTTAVSACVFDTKGNRANVRAEHPTLHRTERRVRGRMVHASLRLDRSVHPHERRRSLRGQFPRQVHYRRRRDARVSDAHVHDLGRMWWVRLTFTDPDCKEAGPIVAADGQCHGFGSTVGSAEYSPIGPTGAACTDPPPAAPSSLTVTNQRTACCLR